VEVGSFLSAGLLVAKEVVRPPNFSALNNGDEMIPAKSSAAVAKRMLHHHEAAATSAQLRVDLIIDRLE
jgi:hypothetical protein